jgi:hypothetical protein
VRAEAVAARVLTRCCVNCGVLRIRQSSLVEIPFIIVFFFCAARLGFSFAHELLCLSKRKTKVVWQLSGLLGKCWGIRFGRERTSGVRMHGPFIKDAVTLQTLHGSVAFDSSTTKVLHRHDRDFLFEGKKQHKKQKNGMLDAPRCKTLLSVAANDLRARKTL